MASCVNEVHALVIFLHSFLVSVPVTDILKQLNCLVAVLVVAIYILCMKTSASTIDAHVIVRATFRLLAVGFRIEYKY